jgi:hypothetical protein
MRFVTDSRAIETLGLMSVVFRLLFAISQLKEEQQELPILTDKQQGAMR